MTMFERWPLSWARRVRRLGVGLVVLAALGGCAQPAGGLLGGGLFGAKPAAGPPPVAAPDARAIDAAAAAIQAGRHQPMPAPQSVARDPGGTVAEYRNRNDTPHRLELLFSGPTSQRLLLDPAAQGNVRLQPGSYLLTVRAADPSVRVLPFAGNRHIEAGVHSSQWYVSSAGAGTPPPATPVAYTPPPGQGLPLTATARQVRDWVGRVHKSDIVRRQHADGGTAIESLMSDLDKSARALLVVGDGSSLSGRCEMLVVHADEVFAFTAPPAATEPCRSPNMATSVGGASGKVMRQARMGTIQSFVLPSGPQVDAGRAFTAEVRLWLDRAPAEPLALRLTMMNGRSTTVFRTPPLQLRTGENVIRREFGPMRMQIPGIAQSGNDGPEGPVVLVSDLTYADNGRMNQLLANSAAALAVVSR